MITMSIDVPVNEDVPAGEEVLSRNEIWRGMVAKARDARDFVPGCTKCEVVDEGDGYVIREAAINGIELKEIISFEDERKVIFHQVNGPWEGIIVNELVDGENDTLLLRFYCLLSRLSVESGGEEELRDQAMFGGEKGYGPAIRQTIATTRRLLKGGKLPA